MDNSPFNRSGITRRTPPPSTPSSNEDRAARPNPPEIVSTSEIQHWISSIEQCLNEVCNISSEGKLNSEQKLRISTLCRKVGGGVSQMAIQYQSLKHRAIQTHQALETQNEQIDLMQCLSEIKHTIKETNTKQTQSTSSFADMVKKGTNNYIRPTVLSSVAIYPSDPAKTSEQTKSMVEKIVCPEEMKLKVRGVRKTRNGGLIISTESKSDLEKLKHSVQQATTGLTVSDTLKRKPRIIIIGVPSHIGDNEVFKCIYEQNLVDKLPSLTKDTFLTSIKLSHKSGKKDSETCNYIIEVPADIRKALITQDRVFINWSSCPVRDFTLVTRCFKCQQYGHAAKSCRNTIYTCGHCGEDGHTVSDCTKTAGAPKCATCMRFKKPSNHKTGDAECPAKKAAELRYINSIDYDGA